MSARQFKQQVVGGGGKYLQAQRAQRAPASRSRSTEIFPQRSSAYSRSTTASARASAASWVTAQVGNKRSNMRDGLGVGDGVSNPKRRASIELSERPKHDESALGGGFADQARMRNIVDERFIVQQRHAVGAVTSKIRWTSCGSNIAPEGLCGLFRITTPGRSNSMRRQRWSTGNPKGFGAAERKRYELDLLLFAYPPVFAEGRNGNQRLPGLQVTQNRSQ